MTLDLRHGEWQQVLADVESVDTIIVDAPYSDRVHKANKDVVQIQGRTALGYGSMSPEEVEAYVSHWSPRCTGWFVTMTCHVLAPIWSGCLEAEGRYVFAPIPVVDKGSNFRFLGDGPSSWTIWLLASLRLVVARPRKREFMGWGTLPGSYIRSHGDPRSDRRGGKPLGIMRQIVRDYSRPGDRVCDTHAGGGTTLLAALLEGRRALGAEVNDDAYASAAARCGAHAERAATLVGVESGRTLELPGIGAQESETTT